MFKITLKTNKGIFSKEYDKTILLSDAMSDMGIIQSHPCGGIGKCKKCSVLINGKKFLSCRTYINEDTTVDYTIDEKEIQGITFGKCDFMPSKPLISSGYAAALDIGTTTLACHIIKFPEFSIVKSTSLQNPQCMHGTDVISRLSYAENGGLSILSDEIRKTVEKMCSGYKIEKYVITGNTAMMHFLTNTDTSPMSKAPFIPNTLFGKWYHNAYITGCISAYIGGDITSAIISCQLLKFKTALLLDIGTNGEIALWHNNNLLCCSAASGPAFEGGNISCGLPATDGAICSVSCNDNTLRYKTINSAPPSGICGSGIIDAVASMLHMGVIDNSGYLEENYHLTENVYISPEDIRNVQLAKSAIRSGIDTLLHELDISASDIEAFCLAGGFGTFISPENAAKIGLIPTELVPKTITCGNAALSGALQMVANSDYIEYSEKITKLAGVTELAENSYFMDKFIDNMYF